MESIESQCQNMSLYCWSGFWGNVHGKVHEHIEKIYRPDGPEPIPYVRDETMGLLMT